MRSGLWVFYRHGISREGSGDASLGWGLFSLFAGWFPASATIFQPSMIHLTPLVEPTLWHISLGRSVHNG